MAQIKKFQNGGDVLNLASKPVESTPETKKKLKFLVDGEEYLMDETEFNAIANTAFTDQVQKGNASLKDRGIWMRQFQSKAKQAKEGVFGIQSSGKTVGDLQYTSNDPNYDGTATDGLTASGEVAQRSTLGRLFAPKKSPNPDQLGGILNGYIGEGVINSRQNYLTAQKTTADAEKVKTNATYNTSIANDIKTLSGGLGKTAFGDEWDDPVAKKQFLDRLHGVEVGHLARVDKAFQDKVLKIFNPYYDDKLEDYKKAGFDVSAARTRLSGLYDVNTKTFKQPLKGISDLFRYSDALNSVSEDSPLYDKKAYLGLGPAGIPKTPEQLAAEKAAQDAALATKTEGDKKVLAAANVARLSKNGIKEDGLAYSSGDPITGMWAPNVAGNNTSDDYYHKNAGWYLKGKLSNKATVESYMESLKSDPKKANEYNTAERRNRLFTARHDNSNSMFRMSNNFIGDDRESVNLRQSGEYAFKDYGETFRPTKAANLTQMFRNAQGQPIKGGIYQINLPTKSLNLGLDDTETVISTDDGKNFRGIFRESSPNKFKLFKKNSAGVLIEETDPSLVAMLAQIANVDKKHLTNSGTSNFNLKRSQYADRRNSGSSDSPSVWEQIQNGASRKNLSFKKLGGRLAKFQIGGATKRLAAQTEAQNQNQNTNPEAAKSKYKSTAITNVFNTSYEMGTQERFEAGALLADIAGVGLAMTGAGSFAAGGIGLAGTVAQFGADVTRDGFQMSDAGSAALSLGLDALSFVPGLGLGPKSLKALNSIKRASKYLAPALAATGAINAGKLLVSLASGDKSFSDLTVDDFRDLTNGIHGVVGGARAITTRAGLKTVKTTKIALAKENSGLDNVLTKNQTIELNKLDGAAKIDKAKLFVAENNPAYKGPVNLKTVHDGFWSNTWDRSFNSANAKVKEVVNLNTRYTGTELEDINDYQRGLKGSDDRWDWGGIKDRFQRFAINKAAMRVPNSVGINTEQEGFQRGKQFGLWGDYTRKNTFVPTKVAAPVTAPVSAPSAAVPPINTNTTSNVGVNFNSQVSSGRRGAATKKQNKANANKGVGEQRVIFKEGGILFAQKGKPIQFKTVIPDLSFEALTGIKKPILNPQIKVPYRIGYEPSNLDMLAPLPVNSKVEVPLVPENPENPQGLNIPGATPSVWDRINKVAGKINGHDLSEFSRALATRAINQRIDTSVGVPLMDAPIELSMPVQGDLLKQAAANNRANDLVRAGGRPSTSDSQLQMIQNLEYNKQAGLVRAQGDLENAAAIQNSRIMNLENVSKHNMIRNEVANKNIASLMNAKQIKIGLDNDKLAMVAQPLMSYWENKNAEKLRSQAQEKSFANQIALASASGDINNMKTPIYNNAVKVLQKKDAETDPILKAQYDTEYKALIAQMEQLTAASKIHGLNIMKNSQYIVPQGYYDKFKMPVHAAGGAINANIKEINKINLAVYKERLKTISTEIKESKKGHAETLKDVQKLITQALKFK